MVAEQYASSLRNMENQTQLQDIAYRIKEQATYLDTILKYPEEKQKLKEKQPALVNLEKRLNEKVLTLLVRQQEANDKEAKVNRL